MFREIRTAIYERLQTLTSTTDDTKPLSLVYEYPITKVEGFPCAMIGLSDSTAEFNSTRENFRTYNFKISVLQTYQADDVREDNEGILMDCFDRIVELFDSDWDL
ncbi:MAG: hypothetical protein LBD75_07410 [Candidatus Peribacteria bacterium]|jgi:hypothetical protein|nr:hypothetical protein [Candidatus Peribacteria bacterium]